MRVITGTAKGRKLKAPKGLDTRPTSDRTKEALFNIIGSRVINANFLDLYAGTGAVGIEAVSRGADGAVFVEHKPRALKVIRENLELTGLADRAEVLGLEADRAIEVFSVHKRQFDIIYIDPPYLKDYEKVSMGKIYTGGLLAPGGLIVVESSKLDVLPEQFGSLTLFRREKYGDTILTFYQNI